MIRKRQITNWKNISLTINFRNVPSGSASANNSGLNITAIGAGKALAELRKFDETPRTLMNRWMTNLQVPLRLELNETFQNNARQNFNFDILIFRMKRPSWPLWWALDRSSVKKWSVSRKKRKNERGFQRRPKLQWRSTRENRLLLDWIHWNPTVNFSEYPEASVSVP